MQIYKVTVSLFFFAVFLRLFSVTVSAQTPRVTWWKFQSVDTMKYSRDFSNIGLPDAVIDTQIKNIAATGATHVAVATPYDAEFLPFLTKWVDVARKYRLNVWFRGNWSGWEKWFGYPTINRAEHLQQTIAFINNHTDLFMPGDIFTPCPECENGGPGDPRKNGDIAGFRTFMIQEYQACSNAFAKIGKSVACNFASMNGDVAYQVMDPVTTATMGGLVVIDHYVNTPEQLAKAVQNIAQHSGGRVILGEIGVPIPDINGKLTDQQQSAWLSDALNRLSWLPELEGLNYWVNVGGSTQIWNSSGVASPAVAVLTDYYTRPAYHIRVANIINQPVQFTVSYRGRTFISDPAGDLSLPIMTGSQTFRITAPTYNPRELSIITGSRLTQIVLDKTHEDLLFKFYKLLFNIKRSIIL